MYQNLMKVKIVLLALSFHWFPLCYSPLEASDTIRPEASSDDLNNLDLESRREQLQMKLKGLKDKLNLKPMPVDPNDKIEPNEPISSPQTDNSGEPK